MKNSWKLALLAALVSVGCHSKTASLTREQKNYQVVQEGSAAGATSTVGAPGEGSIAQTPPITGTNADTTTSFTIASNGAPQAPGTSTAAVMPAPNVGAGGAPAMPNYPIPPGLARTIGGGSSSSSATVARRTAPRETTRSSSSSSQTSQPMTSADTAAASSASTRSTSSTSSTASNTNTSSSEQTASAPPASDSTAPRKSDDHKASPAPAPAPASEPSEEPAPENPPATQTGTFWPR